MHTEEMAVWVRRMQKGDESAFDSLFAAYQKEAVRTAALITGDAFLGGGCCAGDFCDMPAAHYGVKRTGIFPVLVFPHFDQMRLEGIGEKIRDSIGGLV